jgi:S-adenosylmethionine:tRNA ribosyltransferase-isomerase
MTDPKQISIQDYTYDLPEEKIALYPVPERDTSRLLIYQKGSITEDIYKNIHQHLPANSLLLFNDTKVIKARILFKKPTGGVIEIFCLEPFEAINEYSTVMNTKAGCRWKCMIGGASKWKDGDLEKKLANGIGLLKARLTEKLADAYVVEFSWSPADLTFAEMIDLAGDIPLPPYIKRNTEIKDTERYQTIYARDEGSVAAPTAGLHFTENIFSELANKNISRDFVTLHVGAGTFKPVKAAILQDHEMHAEWIEVSSETIKNILHHIDETIVAVGTTSLRTLESLYWLGCKVLQQPTIRQLQLTQWEIYEKPLIADPISSKQALQALLNWLQKNRQGKLFTSTQVLIAPGYQFRLANALVTNFHQPHSTLLLLIAAAVGNDWKKIYDYALQNQFRFLSYGDGSLLFINK